MLSPALAALPWPPAPCPRLPLLTAAILSHAADKVEFQACLETLNRLVSRCNEGARHRERQEELARINNSLDFK